MQKTIPRNGELPATLCRSVRRHKLVADQNVLLTITNSHNFNFTNIVLPSHAFECVDVCGEEIILLFVSGGIALLFASEIRIGA